jgi:hypothetical protein
MFDQAHLKTSLLQPLETFVIPATIKPVAIRDLFKTNTGMKIATVFGEFKSRFFDKSEKPTAATSYRKYKLQRISPDSPILAEPGGEANVEGTLTAALSLLQQQGNGAAGFLQTNGFANIFFGRVPIYAFLLGDRLPAYRRKPDLVDINACFFPQAGSTIFKTKQ